MTNPYEARDTRRVLVAAHKRTGQVELLDDDHGHSIFLTVAEARGLAIKIIIQAALAGWEES